MLYYWKAPALYGVVYTIMIKYNRRTDPERYEGIDNEYKDVRFSDQQLHAIRFGSKLGIDTSVYANPEIPTHLMDSICAWLSTYHTYVIRYTTDSGKNVMKVSYKTESKSEALSMFNSASIAGAEVLDVRLDCEVAD